MTFIDLVENILILTAVVCTFAAVVGFVENIVMRSLKKPMARRRNPDKRWFL